MASVRRGVRIHNSSLMAAPTMPNVSASMIQGVAVRPSWMLLKCPQDPAPFPVDRAVALVGDDQIEVSRRQFAVLGDHGLQRGNGDAPRAVEPPAGRQDITRIVRRWSVNASPACRERNPVVSALVLRPDGIDPGVLRLQRSPRDVVQARPVGQRVPEEPLVPSVTSHPASFDRSSILARANAPVAPLTPRPTGRPVPPPCLRSH